MDDQAPSELDEKSIVVFDMGGTINGVTDDIAAPPAHSRVIEYLSDISERGESLVRGEIVAMKDSRRLGMADRRQLLQRIESAPERLILVPHGTFTLVETARFLEQHLSKGSDKVIVLVGSKIPLGEENSDAPANLQFAIAALYSRPPGVWVAMNSRAWRPEEVEKDLESGDFVARTQIH